MEQLCARYDVAVSVVAQGSIPEKIVGLWLHAVTQTNHDYVSLSSLCQKIGIDIHEVGTIVRDKFAYGPRQAGTLLDTIGNDHTSILRYLGCEGELYIVKYHYLYRGPWDLPHTAVQEHMTTRRLRQCSFIPRVVYTDVTQSVYQYAMEYIPLSVDLVIKSATCIRRVMMQLIRAIIEIHKQGIVHRDIKPDNLRIRYDGTLVLLDFDSSCFIGSQTETYPTIGTPGYRDPYIQHGTKGYDFRSMDIFGCGAVYAYLLGDGKNHIQSGLMHPTPSDRMSLEAAYEALLLLE